MHRNHGIFWLELQWSGIQAYGSIPVSRFTARPFLVCPFGPQNSFLRRVVEWFRSTAALQLQVPKDFTATPLKNGEGNLTALWIA